MYNRTKKDKNVLEKVLSQYNHKTYERKDGLTYYHISPNEIRDLFNRLDLPQLNKKDIDYSKLIVNMSFRQREIFIKNMLIGDGYYVNGKLTEFSQNRGRILDSFTLALTLNGYNFNLSSKGFYKGNECVNIHIINRKHITCQKLIKNYSRVTKVFCVNNKNQTFIAKQGDKVVITGNSLYNAGPATIAKSGNMDLKRGELLHKIYWERNKAVKLATESFLIKLLLKDGNNLSIRIKNFLKLPKTQQKQLLDNTESLWVKNPISGYYVSLRYIKDAFSSVNQNSGVYCFDNYVREVRNRGIKISLQYHDK